MEKRKGKLFEREMLGFCPWRTKRRYRIYYDFEIAVRTVLKQPVKRVSADIQELLLLVAKNLGVDSKLLKCHTSVESPLDFDHGIDAIISWQDGNIRKFVTIDLTLNRKLRQKDTKADIICHKKCFKEKDELALKIAEIFLSAGSRKA